MVDEESEQTMKGSKDMKMLAKSVRAALAAAAIVGLSCPVSEATLLVTDMPTVFGPGSFFNGTVGFRFTTGVHGLTVTSLGLLDANGNGLNFAHDVGLWTTSGTLLASINIPTSGWDTIYDVPSTTDNFVFMKLGTPVRLADNTDYVMGMSDPASQTDNWTQPQLGPAGYFATTSSLGALVTRRYVGGTSLAFPTGEDIGGQALIGPNFIAELTVPEPSTILLLASGGLLAWWRRGRK